MASAAGTQMYRDLHELQGLWSDQDCIIRQDKLETYENSLSSVSVFKCRHVAVLCEEASAGLVWKQHVGRRTGHLPHAMETYLHTLPFKSLGSLANAIQYTNI